MTHGGRAARYIATIILTLLMTVLAAPAHAAEKTASANDSPERAVNAFWDSLQFGQPQRAIAQLVPQCRNKPKVRAVFTQLSHKLVHVVSTTPYYLTVRNYREKVNGRNARTSYDLHIEGSYVDQFSTAFHGQRWVLIADKWYFDCRTGV